jgi:hypothetical protein
VVFADGTSFKGRWEDGAWLQSAADPARCRLRGRGLARAVAGEAAEFTIQVGLGARLQLVGVLRSASGTQVQATYFPPKPANHLRLLDVSGDQKPFCR